MNDPIELIIPMTGVGQRFVDAGYTTLKPLIQTGIGSMVEGVLSNYPSIKKPIFIITNTHPQRSSVIEHIKEIRKEARIFEIEAHKKGPGYAVWQIKDKIRSDIPIVINYCDFSGRWSEEKLLRELGNQHGLILTYSGFHPHMLRSTKFAYVKKNEDGLVIDIREKSSFTDEPMQEEASSGTYGFRDKETLLSALDMQIKRDITLNGELYTSLTYLPLIQKGLPIRTMLIEKFFQWGTPEDLADFQLWNEIGINSFEKLPQKSRNSSTIILAAGLGTRLPASEKPKALIPIFSQPLWNYAASSVSVCRNRLVVTRQDLQEGIKDSNIFQFQILALPFITSGQAETSTYGINILKEKNQPLHIVSCDNIVLGDVLKNIEDMFNAYDIVMWSSSNYAFAKSNPQHFTWIVREESNSRVVKKILFKDAKPPNLAELFIGNVSFKNGIIAEKLFRNLFDKGKNMPKREIYIDHIIEDALSSATYKVGSFEVKKFASIGTPLELLTARYWEEVYDGNEPKK